VAFWSGLQDETCGDRVTRKEEMDIKFSKILETEDGKALVSLCEKQLPDFPEAVGMKSVDLVRHIVLFRFKKRELNQEVGALLEKLQPLLEAENIVYDEKI